MRSPHKVAHPVCPHANWAKCDLAEKVKFGQCQALMPGKKRNSEPRSCENWAVSEKGWCGQHYISETERLIREEKEAAKREAAALQLAAIDAFIAWTAEHPSIFDNPPGSKPMAQTGGRVIPSVVLKEAPPVPKREGGEEWRPKRNKPYRLESPAL